MKKIVAYAAIAALSLSAVPASAAGDTGDTPPGDPVEELAKFFCSIGVSWLCKEEQPKKPSPAPKFAAIITDRQSFG